MKTLASALFSLALLTFIVYLLSAETVSAFFSQFPLFSAQSAGLWLAYLNAMIAAVSMSYSFSRTTKSDTALIGGGLIAASSLGLSASILYCLPYFVTHVAVHYFLLIQILIYLFTAGTTQLVDQLRASEDSQPKSAYMDSRELKRKVLVLLSDAALKLQTTSMDTTLITTAISELESREADSVRTVTSLKHAVEYLSGIKSVSIQYMGLKELIENVK